MMWITIIVEHPMIFFSAITSFIVSVWVNIQQNCGVLKTLGNAIVTIVITLSFLGVFYRQDQNNIWLPLIGVFIGFIGPERIWAATIAAWNSRKSDYINKE